MSEAHPPAELVDSDESISTDSSDSDSSSSDESSSAAAASSSPATSSQHVTLPNVSLRIPVLSNTVHHIVHNPSIMSESGAARQALTAWLLGLVIGASLLTFILTSFKQFAAFILVLSMFHTLEYAWSAIFHPQSLTSSSFLLNHSHAYHIAMCSGVFEYMLECMLFPVLKSPSFVFPVWFGLWLCVCGQSLRTLAMCTAATNFTHQVADHKTNNHQLVTYGVYSYIRHPSYTGWLLWSIGTQVLLFNPVCIVAYAVVSWRFFKSRIEYEESRMRVFWGADYQRYQHQVWSGIPLVQ